MIEDIGTKHPDFEYAYKLNTMNGKTTIIISEHGGEVYISVDGEGLTSKTFPVPDGMLIRIRKDETPKRESVLNRFWRKVWKR